MNDSALVIDYRRTAGPENGPVTSGTRDGARVDHRHGLQAALVNRPIAGALNGTASIIGHHHWSTPRI